jgi:hypothetical protein
MRLNLGVPTREASRPRRLNGRLRWAIGRSVLHVVAAGLAAWCLAATPASAEDLKKSGTVTIEQVQIAFIGSGNLGGGTLKFGGKTYDFSIGGLGIEAILPVPMVRRAMASRSDPRAPANSGCRIPGAWSCSSRPIAKAWHSPSAPTPSASSLTEYRTYAARPLGSPAVIEKESE